MCIALESEIWHEVLHLAWFWGFCCIWGGCLIIWDLHGPGLLVGFAVFLASLMGGVVNSTLNMLFVVPPAHGVGLALGFVRAFGVWGSFEWLGGGGVSLDGVGVLRSCEM